MISDDDCVQHSNIVVFTLIPILLPLYALLLCYCYCGLLAWCKTKKKRTYYSLTKKMYEIKFIIMGYRQLSVSKHNSTMRLCTETITPSGDMMWFSVLLLLLLFYCFFFSFLFAFSLKPMVFLKRKYDHLKNFCGFSRNIQHHTIFHHTHTHQMIYIKYKCCHTKPQIASFLIHERLSLFVKPY